MSKIITVFGATSNQGGSVIKHILADAILSKEFQIRGITRDVKSPAATALTKQGVQMVTADLNSKSSVADALKGAHSVFLVTNYWETATPGVERSQGITVADAAKAAGISHLIYSSLLNVSKATNGRLKEVKHFDEKADIEEYIRASGVPSSFFLPGYFMANYTFMIRKEEDGSYVLAYPVSGKSKFPLIDAGRDTGKWVKAIIKNREKLLGKRVLAATDYYTPEQIVAEFAEVTGNKATYVQITPEQYTSAMPPAAATEYLQNHQFMESPGYFAGASLDEGHAILDKEDKPITWKEFVKQTPSFSKDWKS